MCQLPCLLQSHGCCHKSTECNQRYPESCHQHSPVDYKDLLKKVICQIAWFNHHYTPHPLKKILMSFHIYIHYNMHYQHKNKCVKVNHIHIPISHTHTHINILYIPILYFTSSSEVYITQTKRQQGRVSMRHTKQQVSIVNNVLKFAFTFYNQL